MATKRPNKFEQFEQMYDNYATYSQGLKQAGNSNGITPNLRQLAQQGASDFMPTNTPAQTNYRNNLINTLENTQKPKAIMSTLKDVITFTREDANEFADSNLEYILRKAPEDYVDFAVEFVSKIVGPKNYTGSKAKTYNKITEAQKELEDLANAKSSEIKQKVKEKLESEYDTSKKEEKRALKLLNAVMEMDQESTKRAYLGMVDEKTEAYENMLKGNKIGYLKANLQGEDFVGFYEKSLQTMQKMNEQIKNQRANGNGQ